MFSLLFQALVLFFGNRQTWCWGWPNLADVFGLIRRCRWIEVFTTLRDTIFGLHVWLHSRRVWEFHIPLQQFRRWALERRWQGRVGRTIVLTLVSVNKKNIRTTITPKLQLCHHILNDGENNFISFRAPDRGHQALITQSYPGKLRPTARSKNLKLSGKNSSFLTYRSRRKKTLGTYYFLVALDCLTGGWKCHADRTTTRLQGKIRNRIMLGRD